MELEDRFYEYLSKNHPRVPNWYKVIAHDLAEIAYRSENAAELELTKLAKYVTENFITTPDDVLVDWVISFLKQFKKFSLLERKKL